MEEKRKNKRTDLDINVSLGIITEDTTKEKEYIAGKGSQSVKRLRYKFEFAAKSISS